MKILVVDSEGMGLDFVLRCQEYGHDVKWYCYSTKPEKSGEGFRVKKISDWRGQMTWVGRDGLIVNTGNWRFVHELDRYRDLGFKVFGPTVASAKLEIDRGAGMDAMRSVGIDLPPFQEFDSLDSAYRFARKSDRAWVFKPLGDENDKSITYVSRDPADLAGWLGRQIASGKTLKGKCILQEKIDSLAEIGISGWIGPEGFLLHKWQVCFEHKKLMNGEIGPATGEQGTVCSYVETDQLADEMLKPLEPILRSLGHRGDFAIGAMVDKKGNAWPTEFTSRLGYPSWFIQMASHRGDPAKWMKDLLDGKDTLRVNYDVAIGVVMAQPRYPYGNSPAELVEGNPIAGIETIRGHVHPVNVMIGRGPMMEDDRVVDGPQWQTTGEYVLVTTSLASTVQKAKNRVYSCIDQIHFPNAMYRTDIGDKVIEVLPELHKHGWVAEVAA